MNRQRLFFYLLAISIGAFAVVTVSEFFLNIGIISNHSIPALLVTLASASILLTTATVFYATQYDDPRSPFLFGVLVPTDTVAIFFVLINLLAMG